MFEFLASYPKILVTGVQRSGTTILSHMIEYDTGHKHIDEQDIYVRDIPTFEKYLSLPESMVIHCPALSYCIHNYSEHMIVWSIRPLSEIQSSMARIGLGEIKERTSYNALDDNRSIAQIKYDYWYGYQRSLCKNYLEVEYHNLCHHPLWIDDRKGFEVRQWKNTK